MYHRWNSSSKEIHVNAVIQVSLEHTFTRTANGWTSYFSRRSSAFTPSTWLGRLRMRDLNLTGRKKSNAICIFLLSFAKMRFEPRHDKTNKVTVRPEKTQISMGIRPVWSESSLCAWWVAKDPSFLHADSEDSDPTGRMPRLIWVFAGLTDTLLVLWCRGSFV